MSSSQGNSVPVSDAVSTIILRNYVVYEALKLKIVNFHAVASRIASEVEELTGKEANIETMVVAIKRFSDRLSEGKMEQTSAILKGARLNLAGGVVDATIGAKGSEAHQVIQAILKLAPRFSGTPNIFQLPNSVKVIAEEEDALLIDGELSRRYPVSLKRSVAKITVRMPPAAEKVPGIVSFITELLYRNGVSILDAFLSYEDIVMIVQEKFGPKAYQVLGEETSE
jgi:hypothetical protein